MNTNMTALAFLVSIVISNPAPAQKPDTNVPQKKSVIRLAEIEGRTWLIKPEGKPFFAHGITHVRNPSLRTRYDEVSKACKDLGFNAYGYGCPPELKKDMPYVEGRNYVPISTYRGKGGSFRFIDIFDPREQQKLTAQVKRCCLENRDNPNLIGYYWTDLSAWPLKNSVGNNWVDFTRDLPADAPGHKAYAEFLKTWKGNDDKARDLGFLRVIAREYFRVMGEANRKHDPHHLIFGDRFAFNTIVPEVLKEMLPWVDAIAIQPPFQPGFPKAKYKKIHELTKKPILICDFAIRFKDGNKSIRGWKLQEDARTAGAHYAKYIRAALETPYIIGAFWCTPVDSTPAFNKTGIKQGLFGEGLKPRPGLGETVLKLNQHIAQVTPDRTRAPKKGAKAPEDRSDKRLRDIVKKHFPKGNVHIGATAMSPQGRAGQILAQEFSYITPANDFKQTYIHPEPKQWRWEKPDRWVEFAKQNNQGIRMHGPISPQCSKWAMADPRTADELEENLKEFMTALCKRYNGHKNIRWMDVVNETVNPDGTWKKAQPGTGWEMPWEKIGYEKTPAKYKHLDGKIPKYIIQAFRIATEHAPKIKLVINQHRGMEQPAWNKVKDMILYLRSIGCRVDGVGWQAHIKLIKDDPSQWETGTINLKNLSDLITWLHKHDLEFHVTENNLHVRPKDEGNTDEHAAVYAGILKTLLEKRHTGVVTWNLWDIKDVQHYANKNIVKIGLWDRKFRPKQAYYALRKLLEHPPLIQKGAAKPKVIGNPEFIHLQKDKGVWWLADHTGKRFITTGMNHVGEGGVLFNEVNKGWLTEKFGADIKGSWGGLNPRAKNHGAYADMVVKDFKDYAFNTIPFHAYSTPLQLSEKRKIYYVAKIKVQSISLMQMNRRKGDRFPDVFSTSFRDKLDGLAKKICTPLRDAKYCLGYAYFDMPDLKPVRRWHRQMFPDGGLIYPWVQDMRALPSNAAGKQQWMRILKRNHASALKAAQVYAVDNIASWEDLAKVTSWPIKPNDVPRARKDAEDMLTALAEKWYGLHHELIRKYDPNHLLLGDKHDVGYDKSVTMIPDGVLKAIAKYSDVLMIQYYSFYTDLHNATLRKLHSKTGIPIINGDHSYSFKTSNHTKIKGLEVDSFKAVANEYRRYMKGIMEDHPYTLGWWHCGYIEQWAPAGTKQLGQQCGFFSPFGKPNAELLPLVKEVNENATKWHSDASTNDQPRARKPAPRTPAEMFTALKLTAEQKSKLDVLEKERKAAEAKFRNLKGDALGDTRNEFYAERKKKLRKIFTEEQWAIWSSFWN